MTDPVIFEERQAGAKKIGIASLNVEKSLNALSLAMVDLLEEKLTLWEADDSIACVFLQGVGDKAFCAGGDVIALYDGAAAYGETYDDDTMDQFFKREYELDYHIHTYTKPIVLWGNGIVMGGGLGLMSGASHRVVTESTRMAMPEVTIGLYPDVGGTWFLNHAPGKTGMFLGLTGASFNATDAKFVGLADRFITHDQKDAVLVALTDQSWSEILSENYGLVTHVLRGFEEASKDQQPAGQVHEHLDWINDTCDGDNLLQIIEQITAYDGDDKWLSKAAKTLSKGCPISPHLVWQQFTRGKHLSLKEVFQFELVLSTNCLRQGHFKEGVRALLVEKDRNPQWQPATVDSVTEADISAQITPVWGNSPHPLENL